MARQLASGRSLDTTRVLSSGRVLSTRGWSPNELAICSAWWNADLGSIELDASGNVVFWRNQRHGANITPFSQATSGSRPAYSAAGINSSPALLFDGIDDFMEAGALSEWMSSATGAVYLLFSPLAVDRNSAAAYNNNTVLSTVGSYSGLSIKVGPYVQSFNYDGSYDDTAVQAITLSSPMVARWRHYSGVLGCRVNSSTEVTIASGDIANVAVLSRIGASPAYGGDYTNMYLARMVMLNAEPTAAEDTLIMGWLNEYGGL